MHLTSPCLASFTFSIQTLAPLFLLEAAYLSVCGFAVFSLSCGHLGYFHLLATVWKAERNVVCTNSSPH